MPKSIPIKGARTRSKAHSTIIKSEVTSSALQRFLRIGSLFWKAKVRSFWRYSEKSLRYPRETYIDSSLESWAQSALRSSALASLVCSLMTSVFLT